MHEDVTIRAFASHYFVFQPRYYAFFCLLCACVQLETPNVRTSGYAAVSVASCPCLHVVCCVHNSRGCPNLWSLKHRTIHCAWVLETLLRM